MKIISIDTLSSKYSVAYYNNNNIYYYYDNCIDNNKLSIYTLLNNIFIKNNIKLYNINFLIYNKGPGSLIGKRISLSILKIWNLIYKIPIIGINNLTLVYYYIYNNNYKIKKLISNNITIIIKPISIKNTKFYCYFYLLKKLFIKEYIIKKKIFDIKKIKKILLKIKKGLIITDNNTQKILLQNNINHIAIYITDYIPNAYSLINFFILYYIKFIKSKTLLI